MKLRNFPKQRQYIEGSGGGDSKEPTRTKDSLLSQDYVEILLGLCEGPIKGLAQPKGHIPSNPSDLRMDNIFFGSTPLQNPATGEMNFPDFSIEFRAGATTDSPVKFRLGGNSANLQVSTQLSYNIPVTRTTSVLQRGNFSRLEVRLYFNTLVKQSNSDGSTFEDTALVNVEYKPTQSLIWKAAAGSNPVAIKGKTTTGYVREIIWEVPPLANDDYDIRITKLDRDGTPGVDEKLVDVTWESVQLVKVGDFTAPRLSSLCIYGKASNSFSSVPDISGIYEGAIVKVPSNYNPETRTYDETVPWNGEFKEAYTNCGPWILWDAIHNPYRGMARYYKNVAANRFEFYRIAKWCDQLVPDGNGGYQPRFTFNALIDSAQAGLEYCNYIAGSFNSIIVDDGNGVLTLKTDMPTTPKLSFTPDNVTPEGFSYTFSDVTERFNDWQVVFANPVLNYEEDRRTQSFDNTNEIAKNGRISTDFVAVGCTDVHEATRRANYRYLTATTEIQQVAFTTSRLGFFLERFDTIYVCDPLAGHGYGGRIKSIVGSTIHLRDPLFFSQRLTSTLKLQTPTGLVAIQIMPPAAGNVYSLEILSGAIPGNLPDRTTFTIEGTNNAIGYAKPYRVLTIEEVDGSPDKVAVTAVEVNVNKYPDTESGTQSEEVPYSYQRPGEPTLPTSWSIQPAAAIVGSDGTTIQRFEVTWQRPVGSYSDYFEIDYKLKDDATWTTIKVTGNSGYVQPVQDGQVYTVRLFAVSPLGIRSQRCLQEDYTVILGLGNNLESVNGLSMGIGPGGPTLYWGQPVDIPNFSLTEIRKGTIAQGWDSLIAFASTPDFYYPFGWQPVGTLRFNLKYKDSFNRYSKDPVYLDYTVSAPADPILQIERGIDVVQIKITNEPQTTQPLLDIEIRQSISTSDWDHATVLGKYPTSQRTFTVMPLALEESKIYVRVRDVAGNASNIISTTVPPAAGDIQDLIDLIQNGIGENALSPALIAKINLIDGPPDMIGSVNARLETTTEQIIDATDQALQAMKTQLTASFTAADTNLWSSVLSYTYSKANSDTAIANAINTLQANIAGAGTNLLKNSSFDTDTNLDGLADNWLAYGAGTVTGVACNRGTAPVVHGTHSQRVAAATIGNTGNDRIGVYTPLYPLPSGSVGGKFTISASMAASVGARMTAYVEFYDGSNQFINSGWAYSAAVISSSVTNMVRVAVTSGSVPLNATQFRAYFWLEACPTGVPPQIAIDAAQAQTGVLTSYVGDSSDLVAAIQTEATVRATADGYLGAQWSLRVGLQNNGVAEVAGIAIAGTSAGNAGNRFDMAFRANAFYFMGPAGSSDSLYSPMVFYPAPTVVNGVQIPAGLYLRAAFIEYLRADQIDTRGMTIKDASGNIIFAAGTPLDGGRVTALAGWLNSNIGVNSAGQITGIGSGSGTAVANSAVPSGTNLIPNSDYTSVLTSSFAYGGASASNFVDIRLNKYASESWTDTYTMNGTTRNVVVNQTGPVPGTDATVVMDVYPAGPWDIAHSAPAVAGKKYCASAYMQAHRCYVAVGIQFFDQTGSGISGFPNTDSGAQGPWGGNADKLSNMQRIQHIATAPAGTAFVRMYIRKFNTLAGQGDSYMWYAAPMLEQVGDTTTSPGAYSSSKTGDSSLMGLRSFKVQAMGSGANPPGWLGGGVRDMDQGGARIGYSSTRSWMITEFDRNTFKLVFQQTYDVFGNSIPSPDGTVRNADSYTADLAYIRANRAGNWLIIHTHDEPRNNRTAAMQAEMLRNGASLGKYGQPGFPYRAAYILISQAGCGEGNAALELLSNVGDGSGAYVEATFQWNKGVMTVSGGGTVRNIQDMGYSGEMNATNGATVGSNIKNQAGQTMSISGGNNLWKNGDFRQNATYYDIYSWQSGAVAGSISAGGGPYGTNYWQLQTNQVINTRWGFNLQAAGCQGGWPAVGNHVVSFFAAGNGAAVGQTFALAWNTPPDEATWLENPPLAGNWQRYVIKLRRQPTGDPWFFNIWNGNAGDVLLISCVKVELGDTNSAWDAGSVNGANPLLQSNISTFIQSAAITLALINTASIGSLSALSATIGLLRTATGGRRMEMESNVQRVYDGNGYLRGKWGDLLI